MEKDIGLVLAIDAAILAAESLSIKMYAEGNEMMPEAIDLIILTGKLAKLRVKAEGMCSSFNDKLLDTSYTINPAHICPLCRKGISAVGESCDRCGASWPHEVPPQAVNESDSNRR